MKDLQELFESLGTEEFNKLAETVDKKSLNPKTVSKIMDYIAIVYCAEMNVPEAKLTKEEMSKLIDSFNISMTLYANVINGHMEIKSGRIKLTEGDSSSFSLTKWGIRYVEKLIGQAQ